VCMYHIGVCTSIFIGPDTGTYEYTVCRTSRSNTRGHETSECVLFLGVFHTTTFYK
jgi:hypothetical protein